MFKRNAGTKIQGIAPLALMGGVHDLHIHYTCEIIVPSDGGQYAR